MLDEIAQGVGAIFGGPMNQTIARARVFLNTVCPLEPESSIGAGPRTGESHEVE